DPCIPSDWKGFSVSRRFRGATYNIEVVNSNNSSKGIKEVIVDGKSTSSNVLPVFPKGTEHSVKVIMG
ncbi:MAG TPA: hypothetical protein PKH02_10155, partial [Bacteroidales bacterium]|nr:hypothetical protein [Bacteroidales bacterium]